MMKSVNYRNISNEDIAQVCFVQGDHKEIVIMHEFVKNNKKDYVVLGKLKDEQSTLSGMEYVDWLVIARKLITNYKFKSLPNNFEYEKFLKHNIISNILFTREGYDLITNKFIYTNNLIDRSIIVKTSCKPDRILYESPVDGSILSNENFFDIKYLDKNYFFTKRQINRMEKRNFVKYIKNNLKKINNIASIDSNFCRIVKTIKKPEEKISFIMSYIAENSDKLSNEKSKAIR